MNSQTKEYAEALFLLGKEENSLKEALESLTTVKTELEKNPKYLEFLSSPAVSKLERKEAVEEAFCNNISGNVLAFLKLLIENDRIKHLLEVINDFEVIYNQNYGKCYAFVTCAISLSDAQKNAIKLRLQEVTNREIEPVFTVDKSIIGGIKIEVDGKVYDGSIKHTLNDVKDVITR